jgi:hypothetical protein
VPPYPDHADLLEVVETILDEALVNVIVVPTVRAVQQYWERGNTSVGYLPYEIQLLRQYGASYPEHCAAMVKAVHACKVKGGVVIELYPPTAARQIWFSYFPTPAPNTDPPALPPSTVPPSTTPAQTALPLGSGVPHGEVPPQRRARR